MSHNRPQILPQSLASQFNRTFSIYDFLIHFHSISKHHLNSSNVINYNFSAFLTLDKSRKIIRKKEDQFFIEMIHKVEKQVKLFLDKNFDTKETKEVYKITYSELEKFIQLFETRKTQFVYFQKATLNIQQAFRIGQKDKSKNDQTIKNMKDTMDNFQQKLAILVKKYQERTNISLSNKLRPKFFIKVIQHNEPNTQNPLKIQALSNNFTTQNPSQNLNNKKKFQSRPKTSQVKKIGDSSSNVQKIDHYKQQIMQLKNKYYKLNCKTDICNQSEQGKGNFLRKKFSKTQFTQFFTQPDTENANIGGNENQTNASEMKFSIRFTQDRKKSKINTSFSIFDKSTHNASFFVKNPSNLGQGQDSKNITASNSNISEQTVKKRGSSILRKKSSLLKTSINTGEGYLPKKSNNSVYRQTNFAIQAQRKSSQKRVSTAKPRQSVRKNTQHKTYLFRTSQTEGNIEEENNQQDGQDGSYAIDSQNNEQGIGSNQEGNKLSHFYEEQDDELQVKSINNSYRKTKKGNNRRKGFSKKRIDMDDENQINFIPTVVDMNRKSSIWNESNKQQRSFNRTSFFRSSGYTNKKSMAKPVKTRFNNMNKKLNRNDSKQFSQQALIDGFSTQKTIRNKTMIRDRTKRCLKNHQMAVTVKDCIQLYQDISAQKKEDQNSLHPSYLLSMMRQKYDLKFKYNQQEDDIEENQNSFGGLKFRIMQTDLSDGDNDRRTKWTKGATNFGEMEFAQIVTRKINELGQKNMQAERYSWSDQLQCVKC